MELNGDGCIKILLGEIEQVKCLIILTHKTDFSDPISGLGTPNGYRLSG